MFDMNNEADKQTFFCEGVAFVVSDIVWEDFTKTNFFHKCDII